MLPIIVMVCTGYAIMFIATIVVATMLLMMAINMALVWATRMME